MASKFLLLGNFNLTLQTSKVSTFKERLFKDKSVCIHHRNLQFLAIELYKVKDGTAPEILNSIFIKNESPKETRHCPYFKSRKINSTYHGSESLSFLGPKIWEIIPEYIKSAPSIESFKQKIKKWEPENCPCRICRDYIQGVGFIN